MWKRLVVHLVDNRVRAVVQPPRDCFGLPQFLECPITPKMRPQSSAELAKSAIQFDAGMDVVWHVQRECRHPRIRRWLLLT